MNATHAVPPRHLWWLGVGFTVWCLALVALYALHSLGCAFDWPDGPLRTALVATFVGFLAILGWMWRRQARQRAEPAQGEGGSFLYEVVLWTLIAAWVASALTLGPPLLLSSCV